MPSRDELEAAGAFMRRLHDKSQRFTLLPKDAEDATTMLALAYADELDPTPVDREWAFAVGEPSWDCGDFWHVDIGDDVWITRDRGSSALRLGDHVRNPTRGRVRTEARLRGIVLAEPE